MGSTFVPSWSYSLRRPWIAGILILASGTAVVAFPAFGAPLVASVVRSLSRPVLDASSVKALERSMARMTRDMTPAQVKAFKEDCACVALSSAVAAHFQGVSDEDLYLESFKTLNGLDASQVHERAEAIRANVREFFKPFGG